MRRDLVLISDHHRRRRVVVVGGGGGIVAAAERPGASPLLPIIVTVEVNKQKPTCGPVLLLCVLRKRKTPYYVCLL